MEASKRERLPAVASPPPPLPGRRGALSVLLGLFVLWQLAYLLLASPVQAFVWIDQLVSGDDPKPAWKRGVYQAHRLGQRWEELSGQKQDWSMFAPNFGKQSATLRLELHFENRPPVELYSPLEPDDPDAYFRWPLVHHRRYNAEYDFALVPWFWDPDQLPSPPAYWHAEIAQVVSEEGRYLLSYLRARRDRWVAEHPDEPAPTAVLVRVALRPSPPANEAGPARPPWQVTLARWRCGGGRPGSFEVEAYDPRRRRFAPLPRGPIR